MDFSWIDKLVNACNIILLIVLVRLTYIIYYKKSIRNLMQLEKYGKHYVPLCYFEEIFFLLYILLPCVCLYLFPDSSEISPYPILTDNHKDLLVVSLTVFSITIAAALACINFEKNMEYKFIEKNNQHEEYTKKVISILYRIKLFSSGYRHLWISVAMISYTVWLLLQLANNGLHNPVLHYWAWSKLFVIYGVSFFKVLLEFSILSREISDINLSNYS